jgi:DNA-binding XRE family transcriptional regulator
MGFNAPVPPKKRIIRMSLPEQERAICARLREVRQYLRLTQTEFAAQIGLTRESLASYEDARAPLRFHVGLTVCRQFLVSEKWLAHGLMTPLPLIGRPRGERKFTPVRFGEMRSRLFKDLAATVKIEPKMGRALYSAGFDLVLSQAFERSQDESTILLLPKIALSSSDNISLFRNVLAVCSELLLECLEVEKHKRFLWALVR